MPVSTLTFDCEVTLGDEASEPFLAQLRRGDAEAVARLYDQHHTAIRTLGRRLLGDRAAAEDLVHEVFVALPAAMQRYRRDAALRTFLFSIALNMARKHVRAAARRRRATVLALDDVEGTTPDSDFERRELAR